MTEAKELSVSTRAASAEPPTLHNAGDHWLGRFVAMSCPCEVLIDTRDEALAGKILCVVEACARRIERKFSRYRDDNIIHRINAAQGAALTVDDETANLLDFAATLAQLSGGSFDITSGVLRRAWKFDGGERIPTQTQIDELLPLVGWSRVDWRRPVLQMPAGMQIDFGGLGKEYAVDLAAAQAHELAPEVSVLINFGGDVAVKTARTSGAAWRVGIERVEAPGDSALVIPLTQGALATSGDSRRFVIANGKRYAHILDARTGWPVDGAPRSVTVAADTCTQAG